MLGCQSLQSPDRHPVVLELSIIVSFDCDGILLDEPFGDGGTPRSLITMPVGYWAQE